MDSATLPPIQLYTDVSGRAVEGSQVFWSLPPTWKTQMELHDPGFALIEAKLLQPSDKPADKRDQYLSQISKIKLFKIKYNHI